MPCVLAFDPGKSGGYAVIHPHGYDAAPLPMSGDDLDEFELVDLVWRHVPDMIVIERVSNMLAEDEKGDRTRKNGATSMFSFGKSYGVLRGICRAYQRHAGKSVTIDHPLPNQWKPIILPGNTKGKQGAIEYCKVHFSDVNLILPRCRKEHTGMADALCLARYGQKILEKKLVGV